MSRSNPTLINPAQHFFEWSGSKGQLEFYDKEKKERIKMPLPLEFLVLDQLATIIGYSKPDKNSFYSNEVRNSAKEEFTVRIKGAVRYSGLYKNEQGSVQVPRGAKYAKAIYFAHKNKAGNYIIGNFKASGSALTAWIELTKNQVVENGKVILAGSKKETGELGDYFVPVFKYTNSNAEEDRHAIELDKELQTYLNQYLAAAEFDRAHRPDDDIDQSVGLATEEEIADYEAKKQEAFGNSDSMERVHAANPMNPDVIIEDMGDEPINLDDIPF